MSKLSSSVNLSNRCDVSQLVIVGSHFRFQIEGKILFMYNRPKKKKLYLKKIYDGLIRCQNRFFICIVFRKYFKELQL